MTKKTKKRKDSVGNDQAAPEGQDGDRPEQDWDTALAESETYADRLMEEKGDLLRAILRILILLLCILGCTCLSARRWKVRH
jgi:hypothetical protein